MAHVDRKKHDFDVFERVFGGVRAFAGDNENLVASDVPSFIETDLGETLEVVVDIDQDRDESRSRD
jgi:hypothetical protein